MALSTYHCATLPNIASRTKLLLCTDFAHDPQKGTPAVNSVAITYTNVTKLYCYLPVRYTSCKTKPYKETSQTQRSQYTQWRSKQQ